MSKRGSGIRDWLTELLPAVNFMCLDFRTRRLSDETPLGKVLKPYWDQLNEHVQALNDTLAVFRPALAEPKPQAELEPIAQE